MLLFRGSRIAGDIERQLQPQHVVRPEAVHEFFEVLAVGPFPGRTEEVPVSEDETAGCPPESFEGGCPSPEEL